MGSAGWGWQQVDGTFDSTVDANFSVPTNGDGFRASGEIRFSRILYRTTRWNVGARFTSVDLADETPQYVSLILGAQMRFPDLVRSSSRGSTLPPVLPSPTGARCTRRIRDSIPPSTISFRDSRET